MGFCFLCDGKLIGEKTRVCSSVTPHSKMPYPEKIVELLGEEFVVIVTPTDYICKSCTSLLTHMDKLENDLNLVRTALITYVQKKYGILPANQPVMSLDVVNGHLKAEELEVGQRKVPSGLNLIDNSVSSTFKMTKPQQDDTSKIKIFKCGFCSYQSRDLSIVRSHMRIHLTKGNGNGEKRNQTATKTLIPAPEQQKKQLFRCQVCSKSFDSRLVCFDHIQKNHQQIKPANEGNKTESVSSRSPTKVFRPMKTLNSVGHQQTMSYTHVDGQKENKGVVNTGMLLKDNGSVEDSQAEKQEPTNSGNKMPAKKVTQIEQDTIDNIVREAVGNIAICGEDSKTEDLDLESMLALIHNHSPSIA